MAVTAARSLSSSINSQYFYLNPQSAQPDTETIGEKGLIARRLAAKLIRTPIFLRCYEGKPAKMRQQNNVQCQSLKTLSGAICQRNAMESCLLTHLLLGICLHNTEYCGFPFFSFRVRAPRLYESCLSNGFSVSG